MGVVYLAEHPVIGSKVALKAIHPELSRNPEVVSRFVTEAKAVNQIGHEHIVDITDFGTTADGEFYFIMEYLQGETLSDRLQARAAPSRRRARCTSPRRSRTRWPPRTATAIIHRDLKPENIFLIERDGRPGLRQGAGLRPGQADAGRREGHAQDRAPASVMGTPYYMSPEQCEGKAEHRSPRRHLLAGRDPVRDADRQGAVRRRGLRRDHRQARHHAAAVRGPAEVHVDLHIQSGRRRRGPRRRDRKTHPRPRPAARPRESKPGRLPGTHRALGDPAPATTRRASNRALRRATRAAQLDHAGVRHAAADGVESFPSNALTGTGSPVTSADAGRARRGELARPVPSTGGHHEATRSPRHRTARLPGVGPEDVRKGQCLGWRTDATAVRPVTSGVGTTTPDEAPGAASAGARNCDVLLGPDGRPGSSDRVLRRSPAKLSNGRHRSRALDKLDRWRATRPTKSHDSRYNCPRKLQRRLPSVRPSDRRHLPGRPRPTASMDFVMAHLRHTSILFAHANPTGGAYVTVANDLRIRYPALS